MRVKIKIDDEDINRLIHALADYDIRYISEVKQTLEDYFMHFYNSEANDETNQNTVGRKEK